LDNKFFKPSVPIFLIKTVLSGVKIIGSSVVRLLTYIQFGNQIFERRVFFLELFYNGPLLFDDG